jgi:hypothetical protein
VTCLHTNSPGHIWTTLYIWFMCFMPCIKEKLVFMQKSTNAHLSRCLNTTHLYSLQRHVSITFVTVLRALYSKNTSNTPVITQKMIEKTVQGCYQLDLVNILLQKHHKICYSFFSHILSNQYCIACILIVRHPEDCHKNDRNMSE